MNVKSRLLSNLRVSLQRARSPTTHRKHYFEESSKRYSTSGILDDGASRKKAGPNDPALDAFPLEVIYVLT